MIKKFLKKKTHTKEDLLKELLSSVFNSNKIEEIFNDEINLNESNDKGETFLHLCSKKGCLESAKWLLEKGVDIDTRTKEQNTPLFYAALSNSGALTHFLITKGANTNHTNVHKRTALQEALIAGKRTINTLFEHTDELNNSDIHGNNLIFDAVANGSKELIEKVIKNKSININKLNNAGNTILHKEAVLKNNDLAMRMLEEGADPTILDKSGKNFLFYAVSKGIENEEILDKAIELGCDLNSRCSNNKTILMQSVENYLQLNNEEKEMKQSHLKMIKKLINEGIQVDAVDNKNETVLFDVVRSGNTDLIELFIKHDSIHLNDQNIEGETVLTISALKGISYTNFILNFLKNGADVNLVDKNGSSVIEKLIEVILHYHNRKRIDDYLLERIHNSGEYIDVLKLIFENTKVDLKKLNSRGHPLFFDSIIFFNYPLFKMLRQFGININQKDKDNHNIIFYLMDYSENSPTYNQKMYLDTLQNLINIGVNVDSKDLNGSTALHKAVLEKCEYTIKVLLNSKINYFATDKKGRTIIHNTIWKNDLRFFKLIHTYDDTIINFADNYGVLPINYAAFMGKYELVKIMLESGAHINNTNDIDPRMIEFFKKFHKNIINLENKADNEVDKLNLKLLADSMKINFDIKI